ncbi:uncharacterized protein G2W53_013120 [Senna tora]|uniref:Uncharacterized protein n=1 Tax=Senna tora TaxID=362788 RepID=A0A834U071_9FABA|nr:uncharacterized protein G2W53_013120 [Senna tora]
MGNCLGLCELSSRYGMVGDLGLKNKVVRVAKMDGKILEFSSPVLVKQVLTNFPALGICASKEASQFLSPEYELKAGRLYYLLPSSTNVSCIGNTEGCGGTKRVKVVITKKQLQQLVSKQISIEDLLSLSQVPHSDRSSDLQNNWRPKLDSIPEGNE